MHFLGTARHDLALPDSTFADRGDVAFDTLASAHALAFTLNTKTGRQGAELLRGSDLYAMALVHEVFHAVVKRFRTHVAKDSFERLGAALRARGIEDYEATLRTFVELYPPRAVMTGGTTAKTWLATSSEGIPNEEWALVEILLLWLTAQNPGYDPVRAFVSDAPFAAKTKYREVMQAVTAHFEGEPAMGSGGESLVDLLLAPIRHAPHSLEAQLRFMRESWGISLDELGVLFRLLGGIDFILEEGRWFLRKSHGQGEGPSEATHFDGALYEHEPERFSADLDWMPKVVMIAKSTFVWLDQLGKKYGRPVRTLADVPDEELDLLARRNFTALWLIGLWKRSAASERIKRINGNPEAVASAYSLHDYEIAPELGGHDAWVDLSTRAGRRGIRLASDMVPNHMGLDSSWVVDHPDWFVQSHESPFPNYTFGGPDLSSDDRVGLYLEDGYWSRTDAAVVFKRVDKRTGETRFVYHGNDGTSMPWNDTAQLNYLMPEVREAVIQTILHVARMFPVIRFDAAMTLAKKHYQRLWFPVPGSGADIPSRSAHALTKPRFDELFPEEFWREVVDRVAREVPNTLLLAEAFWMMEGYFVRTLGMHRVYNSAFMHMLKREDNDKFRESIKNVLEFNPQILKRHVNFMNNPDEETAVAQFGKDGKYFCVCMLMSTLPGLPMFGHGQIEGLGERYGMEYKRAYWDEMPDQELVRRHEREIFPILARRWLFADVAEFCLYDFETDHGVDEDVYAYSNRVGDSRGLVVVHNKWKETRGHVRLSAPTATANGLERRRVERGLGLRVEPGVFTIWRDVVTGLEFLRENVAIARDGLHFSLGAFEYHAFVDFREVVSSDEAPWSELARELGANGVPDMDRALVAFRFRGLHDALYEATNAGSAAWLFSGSDPAVRLDGLMGKVTHVVQGLAWVLRTSLEPKATMLASKDARERFVNLEGWIRGGSADTDLLEAETHASTSLEPPPPSVRSPKVLGVPRESIAAAVTFVDLLPSLAAAAGLRKEDALTWHLASPLKRAFATCGTDGQSADRLAAIVLAGVGTAPGTLVAAVRDAFADPALRAPLGVNVHGGTTWFDRDALEALVTVLAARKAAEGTPVDVATLDRVLGTARTAGYALDAFVAALAPKTASEHPKAPKS
ncbi:MAG: alpha-amylase family glycosyl hydrolase [Polyangiaceae bacterium]